MCFPILEVKVEMDCDPARLAVLKGISIALRYIRKYQFISIAGLHAVFKMEGMKLGRCDTAENDSDSDIFTKPLGKVLHHKNRLALGIR